MKYLFIGLIMFLFSCQSFKQWKDKGISKGWYKENPIKLDTNKTLVIDTGAIINILDSSNNKINHEIDSSFIGFINTSNNSKDSTWIKSINKHIYDYNSLREKIKKEVTKEFKNSLKPKIIKVPFFKDDSLLIKKEELTILALYKNGKLDIKVQGQTNTIITPIPFYKEYWWIWAILAFALGIFVMWLAKYKLR